MGEEQDHRPDQEHHALNTDGFLFAGADRDQVDDQRRPPDARDPAVKAADNAEHRFECRSVMRGHGKAAARQLPERKAQDRQAQRRIHQRLRDRADELRRQHEEHHDHRYVQTVLDGRGPGGRDALPEGLGDIDEDRRHDQQRQRRRGRQERAKGRHQDHRHGKADRALDEAREGGDRERKPDLPEVHSRHAFSLGDRL